jgi:hypothetical protein
MDGPTVQRPLAGLVRITGANLAWPSPRHAAEIIRGIPMLGHIALAGDDGLIEFRVNPEEVFRVHIATDYPGRPHDVDPPAGEPETLENQFRRNIKEHLVPVTRDHRIEVAVRLLNDGQHRIAVEGATFHEIAAAQQRINGA